MKLLCFKSIYIICFLIVGFTSFSQNTLDKAGLTSSAPATAAYSTRLLSSTYTGTAIRVRRTSDNSEADIGFTPSGDLDQSALLNFVYLSSGLSSITSPYPLDRISTSPAVAYSLRKLKSSYNGNAIRVRRAVDNSEMDIGFNANGGLNQSDLIDFVNYNSDNSTNLANPVLDQMNIASAAALSLIHI
jgi:hypothetical protein